MAEAPPIEDTEFARLMAPFAPFEHAPELAVAVSGGADSLCLARLAGRWVRARGGVAVGLVVDHGLRPDSATEAVAAAECTAAFGLHAHILPWQGPKPVTGVQAAARTARYDLLAHACRERGVLHLLLGHHAGDQAETVLIRRAAGSGADGLAGMASVTERHGIRLLRPFLPVPPCRLRATLAKHGVTGIEDPSNRDPAYARTAARRYLARAGDAPALVAEARRRGRERAAHEGTVARVLRQAVRLDPRGAAAVNRDCLTAAPHTVALTALARVVRCIGGRVHPPRSRRLSRALTALCGAAPAVLTLGGCRIAARGGLLTVTREAAPVPDLPLAAGATAHWDGRFAVAVSERCGGAAPYRVTRLDDRSWAALRRCNDGAALPPPLRAGLPVLHDLDGPLALPHLSARRGERAPFTAEFRPLLPLAGPRFAPAADIC